MAVSAVIIRAYKAAYSLQELRDMLKIALAERSSGVAVTQINMQDAGGAGERMPVDPNEIVEILQLAIEQYGNALAVPPGMTSAMNFGCRRLET